MKKKNQIVPGLPMVLRKLGACYSGREPFRFTYDIKDAWGRITSWHLLDWIFASLYWELHEAQRLTKRQEKENQRIMYAAREEVNKFRVRNQISTYLSRNEFEAFGKQLADVYRQHVSYRRVHALYQNHLDAMMGVRK